MEEGSRDLTTFVCHYGKYHFRRMPFELRNAPAVFQQAVQKVLKNDANHAVIILMIIWSTQNPGVNT